MKPLFPPALTAALMMIGAGSPAAAAPSDPAVTTGEWQGHVRHSFSLGGHAAHVVVPPIAAAGKPWIWRTAAPDDHPEVDLELLRCGYHLGVLEIAYLYGSDRALELMDQFYTRVRSQWGLAAKPALEPNGPGGLAAYRYAARHPGRVACILGTDPLMDFKTWPLKTAPATWSQLLAAYGFETDAAAIASTGNPIDQLAPLAAARIPLRHTLLSPAAPEAPAETNTFEARRRLQRLGWDLSIVSPPASPAAPAPPAGADPQVFESVRFVMDSADERPAGHDGFQLRSGLANSKARFETAKTGRVAFLGGSITYNGGWRDEVMSYLQQKFPATRFEFIAAGIPSVGSNGHAFRLQTDIFKDGPVDLLFVEAAVNDITNIPDQPVLMLRSMEGVIRQARLANPYTDIVQLHFVSPESLRDHAAGREPVAIAQHEKVAAHYGCPSLDLARECADRIAAGQFTWAGEFKGDVHPPPFGQRLYANSIMRLLDAGYDPVAGIAATATAAAAPQAHPIPPEPLDPASYIHGRYGRLEDARLGAGFTLDPAWAPAKGATRDGFTKVPALVAATPGAEFSYEFEGTAFGLFLAAGYDTCVLESSVDGGPFRKLDSSNPWSGSLHLPWPVMLADGLKAGKHRILVRTTADQPGRTALHVIHILVN